MANRRQPPRWRFAALIVVLGAAAVNADVVFKYVDDQGQVIFSDEPLDTPGLKLEWKRSSSRLSQDNRQHSQQQRQQQAQLALARQEARREAVWERLFGTSKPVESRPRPSASGSMAARREQYRSLINQAAQRYNLPPELLHAVIRAESAYRPDALSHAGASGLMQLMPATAKRFGVTDIWDPAQNIDGGARFLRFLLDKFDGDLRLVLAGYNAGENAVIRHGRQIPPFAETQNYVRTVLRYLHASNPRLRS